jgi:hypothetical protein
MTAVWACVPFEDTVVQKPESPCAFAGGGFAAEIEGFKAPGFAVYSCKWFEVLVTTWPVPSWPVK